MSRQSLPRWIFPVAALAFAASQLAYEHFNGGVVSHNLLNRRDLPAISNWWGLLTLPLLGLLLAWRIRALRASTGRAPRAVLVALAGAFAYGAVLAGSFALGAEGITSVVFVALFAIALVLPVYRAEYLLGFVAGMTVTFGGVLPLLVASVVATVSFAVRSAARFIGRLVRRRQA
jgi:hypothetical protein